MNRRDYLGVGFFVHPVPAFAVLILFVNDHYLKYHFTSWWTGKLSDFAGLFFFPLFLCAIWVMALNLVTRRENWLTKRNLLVAVIITDAVFVAVKLNPSAAAVYEQFLGWAGFPSRLTMDPTDLAALAMNATTYWYAWPFVKGKS